MKQTATMTADPTCNNCKGTGVFTSIDTNTGVVDTETCIFCLEDAILRGEIDGTIDGVDWKKGRASSRMTNS